MALSAREPAFGNGMMTGQLKLSAHVHMTLEADGFSRTRRLNGKSGAVAVGYGTAGRKAVRGLGLATGIGVKAAWAVAGFATGIEGVGAFGNQTGLVRGREIAVNFFVALLAFFGADVLGAGHIGQHHHRTIHGAAGDACHQEKDRARRQAPGLQPRCPRFSLDAKIQLYHVVTDICPITMSPGRNQSPSTNHSGCLIRSPRSYTRCQAGAAQRMGCEPLNCRH